MVRGDEAALGTSVPTSSEAGRRGSAFGDLNRGARQGRSGVEEADEQFKSFMRSLNPAPRCVEDTRVEDYCEDNRLSDLAEMSDRSSDPLSSKSSGLRDSRAASEEVDSQV